MNRNLIAALAALFVSGSAAADFAVVDRADSPFAVVDYRRAAPSLSDLDGDVDLDLLVGGETGELRFYRNTGTRIAPAYAQATGADNPLSAINAQILSAGLTFSVPHLADINLDGRVDVVVGFGNGAVYMALADGSGAYTSIEPLTVDGLAFDVGRNAAPQVLDFDADGDPDLLIGGTITPATGSNYSTLSLLSNQAGNWTVTALPAGLQRLTDSGGGETWVQALLLDLDRDGDRDFVAGIHRGLDTSQLSAFGNSGTNAAPVFVELGGVDNPFDGIGATLSNWPSISQADIDGDGDVDLLIGGADGRLHFVRDGDSNVLPGPLAGMVFDAVEPGAGELSAVLKTGVAGIAKLVDIVALLPDRVGLNAAYIGNLQVQLLNTLDNSGPRDSRGCRSSWVLLRNVGGVSLTALDQGRKSLTLPVLPDAARQVRLRLTDTLTGFVYCSSDAFAVRPASFSLSFSDGGRNVPGTLRVLNSSDANGSLVHTAGAAFTARITALNAAGNPARNYAGAPSLEVVAPQLGAATGGLFLGAATAANGEVTSQSVSYGEIGAVLARAIDDSYALVDAADTPDADRRVASPGVTLGRFVPADFDAAQNAPSLSAGCPAFSYVGQTLAYSVAPQATVTPLNAAGGAVANYRGSLFKLSAASVSNQRYSVSGHSIDSSLALTAAQVVDNADSTATVRLEQGASVRVAVARSTPVQPFAADIRYQVDMSDADSVDLSQGLNFGDGLSGLDFVPAGVNTMRFGRMRLINSYGSQKHPLDVPVILQYFADLGGSGGFVTHTDDCLLSADLPPSTFVLDESGLGDGSPGQTLLESLLLGAGSGRLRLSAPTVSGAVSISADLAPLMPWLLGDWNGDGVYSDEPSALVRFGVPSDRARVVDRREVIP